MQLQLLPREITPATVLTALEGCIGPANGMTATQLTQTITGRHNAADERRLRQVIEQLRLDGHAVCATPAHGYFMAATAADIDQTGAFLVARAMTSLRQWCAMKHRAVPDLYGQLGLPLPANQDPEVTP